MCHLVGIEIECKLVICGRLRCDGRLDADAKLCRSVVSLKGKSKVGDTNHGASGEPFHLRDIISNTLRTGIDWIGQRVDKVRRCYDMYRCIERSLITNENAFTLNTGEESGIPRNNRVLD